MSMEELKILPSIKKLLGITVEYKEFDQEIRMHIDSVFVTLHQLGVGPTDPFYLETGEESWSEFMENAKNLRNVKSYIYLRTRLLFDMPQNAFLVTAIEKQIKELEWRMMEQSKEEVFGQNGS